MVGLEILVYVRKQDSQPRLPCRVGSTSRLPFREGSLCHIYVLVPGESRSYRSCDRKKNVSAEIGGKLAVFGALFPVSFCFI